MSTSNSYAPMSANIALIFKKLEHLTRMREYMLYSLSQTQAILPVQRKYICERRNAVNHEYEENTALLSEFFEQLTLTAPTLLAWHDQLQAFCNKTYQNT